MNERLDRLKRDVFFELLDLAGRVFIVVRNGEGVRIGSRGFTPQEEENGLVLVLNRRMSFRWEDDLLEARLVFGTDPHDCVIPARHIVAVNSPELQTQLVVAGPPETAGEAESPPAGSREAPPDGTTRAGGKVVRVDFSKKKR